ncbi:MAG: hypothetical protein R3F11_09465 [Verrucomicrobiales bacterium]
MTPSLQIKILVPLAIAISALAVPVAKLAVGDEMGLAAAGVGAITFLAMLGLAGVFLLYVFILALAKRRSLSTGTFLLGLLPFPLAAATSAVLFLVAARIQTDRANDDLGKRPTSPAAEVAPPAVEAPHP